MAKLPKLHPPLETAPAKLSGSFGFGGSGGFGGFGGHPPLGVLPPGGLRGGPL